MLTGARRSEMQKLRWDQVNFDTMTIELDEYKGDTQEAEEKPIIISSALETILRRREKDRMCEYVFPANKDDGSGLTHVKNLHLPWKKALVEANVWNKDGKTSPRIHDMRHSFASTAKARGHDIPVVGDALGHKSRQTTEGYTHGLVDNLRDAVEDISASIADDLGLMTEGDQLNK